MADSPSSALGALLGLCVVLGSVGACRSSQRHGDGNAARSSSSATATPATSTSDSAAAPSASAGSSVSPLDEARARGFVTLWAQASKRTRFRGVQRVIRRALHGVEARGQLRQALRPSRLVERSTAHVREGVSVQLSDVQVSLGPRRRASCSRKISARQVFTTAAKRSYFWRALVPVSHQPRRDVGLASRGEPTELE